MKLEKGFALDKKTKNLLIVLALLVSVCLGMLVYKGMFQDLKALRAEKASLETSCEATSAMKDELTNYFPAETKRLTKELEERRSKLVDYDNNYDYHYELVNLAAEHSLSVSTLEIGEPVMIELEDMELSAGGYAPFVRTVVVSLGGSLQNFLAYADDAGKLGDNVQIETNFAQGEGKYTLTALFYSLEAAEEGTI